MLPLLRLSLTNLSFTFFVCAGQFLCMGMHVFRVSYGTPRSPETRQTNVTSQSDFHAVLMERLFSQVGDARQSVPQICRRRLLETAAG